MSPVTRIARAASAGIERVYHAIDRVFAWSILGPTLVVVCAVLGAGYLGDRRSCERTQPARETIKRFVSYQTVFQGALSSLDPANGPRATIVDPDTGAELDLDRGELRTWVQGKQRDLADALSVPNCATILPGK